MNVLKHVWLDLIVTAIIIVATMWEPNWAVWIVLIYTPVMFVLKMLPLAGGLVQRQFQQSGQNGTPTWLYHVLYGMNAGFLLAASWWYTGAAWLGIWFLSWMARRQPEPSSS